MPWRPLLAVAHQVPWPAVASTKLAGEGLSQALHVWLSTFRRRPTGVGWAESMACLTDLAGGGRDGAPLRRIPWLQPSVHGADVVGPLVPSNAPMVWGNIVA